LARKSRGLLLVLGAVLAVGAASCGEEGADEGAALTVYVSAPLRGSEAPEGRRLCAEARETARLEGPAGGHELRVVCLDASGEEGRWTLAQVGANARRATEDSAAVAYIGEPDPAARRQSRPIVEAAEMVEFGNGGREAIEEVHAALEEGDASDPRQTVFDAVEG
jgi:hypothetical protein